MVFYYIDPYFRWKVSRNNVRSSTNKARIGRYELDDMHIDQICWRPYRYFPTDELPTVMERRLWSAQCPLLFHSLLEWYYPDRVTRQFGFVQDIPTRSPVPGHDLGHCYTGYADLGNDLAYVRAHFIQLWEARGANALSPPSYVPARSNERVSGYDAWFQTITRRFILEMSRWREHGRFQGSQSFRGGGSSSRGGRPRARPVMPETETYRELAGEGWEPWHQGANGSQTGGAGGWDDQGAGGSQMGGTGGWDDLGGAGTWD